MSNTPILWYVIQTKPKHEEVVARQLARIRLQVLSPKIWGYVRTRSGGQTQSIRPLFPGYIFIAEDLKVPEIFRLVRYTRGVNKVLTDGQSPLPMHDDIMETIRSRMGPDGIIKPVPTLKEGDEIRVRHGFLKDLMGIMSRPTSDGERVVVLLRLLQKQVKVTLPVSQVEKLG